MASLSRGISFRRQGSSGLSWADTWSFNEEGVLVMTLKEEEEEEQQQNHHQLHHHHRHHHRLQARVAGSALPPIDHIDIDDSEIADAADDDVANAHGSATPREHAAAAGPLAATAAAATTTSGGPFHTYPRRPPPSSTLHRSKSVGSSHPLHNIKPPPGVFFRWIKKTLHKIKK